MGERFVTRGFVGQRGAPDVADNPDDLGLHVAKIEAVADR